MTRQTVKAMQVEIELQKNWKTAALKQMKELEKEVARLEADENVMKEVAIWEEEKRQVKEDILEVIHDVWESKKKVSSRFYIITEGNGREVRDVRPSLLTRLELLSGVTIGEARQMTSHRRNAILNTSHLHNDAFRITIRELHNKATKDNEEVQALIRKQLDLETTQRKLGQVGRNWWGPAQSQNDDISDLERLMWFRSKVVDRANQANRSQSIIDINKSEINRKIRRAAENKIVKASINEDDVEQKKRLKTGRDILVAIIKGKSTFNIPEVE